jgi:hypothetical protein
MTKDQEMLQLMRETLELQQVREHLKEQTEELKKAMTSASFQSSVNGS